MRLNSPGLTLGAILLTHHHHDHIDGVPELLAHYPDAICYGPAAEHPLLPTQQPLHNGQRIVLDTLEISLEIMALPGHTREHIAYSNETVLQNPLNPSSSAGSSNQTSQQSSSSNSFTGITET